MIQNATNNRIKTPVQIKQSNRRTHLHTPVVHETKIHSRINPVHQQATPQPQHRFPSPTLRPNHQTHSHTISRPRPRSCFHCLCWQIQHDRRQGRRDVDGATSRVQRRFGLRQQRCGWGSRVGLDQRRGKLPVDALVGMGELIEWLMGL